jgi:hypothetical protein
MDRFIVMKHMLDDKNEPSVAGASSGRSSETVVRQ